MPGTCPECGAPMPAGGECRDSFNALLALEWELSVSAPEGKLAHFYAVSSFILQHPGSMQFTEESYSWLRSSVATALAGQTSTDEMRRQARGQGENAHITRRPGDPVPVAGVHRWTMTVAGIVEAGTEGYCDRVRRWAESVIRDLDEAGAHAG